MALTLTANVRVTELFLVPVINSIRMVFFGCWFLLLFPLVHIKVVSEKGTVHVESVESCA